MTKTIRDQRAVRRLGVKRAATAYIGYGGDDELTAAEHAGLCAYRAAWFVRKPSQNGTWPELTEQKDVLKLVAQS